MRHHHFDHEGHHHPHGRLHEALHDLIGRRRHGHHFNPFGGLEEDGEQRRRGRVFDSTELRLVLLKLVSEQPRHGYDLIRAIEELTGGAYSPSPGVVYPTLTLLSEMGHIREDQGDGNRKTYSATPDGVAHLDARKAEIEALMARLAELASLRERFDRAPVRRAMMNLRAVLMNKLGADGANTDKLHAVTGIIDDAAQRIERL